MFWIIPLAFLILLEATADIFSKEYSLKGNWYWWAAAITGYIIANIFWLWSIRTGSGLARGGIIFSVGSAILAIILGVYIYHEHASRHEIIGMLLGIVALALIFWE